MNGDQPKIEIFEPFGAAFELMKRILFKPFDLGKWCVIGFAAFLANLSGNAGFNYGGNSGKGDWSFRSTSQGATGSSDWLTSCAIPLLVVLVVLAIVITAVLVWLGCRGRFIFTDCIVRNRDAIVEPWREFRREGNSFFLFSLVVGLVVVAIIALAFVPVLLPFLQGWKEGTAFVASLTFGIVLVVGVIFVIAVTWGLISQLMVPVMYRQRCRALVAFREVVGLIVARPGPILLYLLFFFVLALATAVIFLLSLPFTCCIAAIPYVGTVVLLPIYVVLAAFPLFFLRQFGPEYDVWASTDVRPPIPPSAPPGPILAPAE